MKFLPILLISLLFSCTQKNIDPERFKTGTFVIPASKSEGPDSHKITIFRTKNIQIQQWNNQLDTMKILWLNNFKHQLILKNSTENYTFAIINATDYSYDYIRINNNSNNQEKGTVYKISDEILLQKK